MDTKTCARQALFIIDRGADQVLIRERVDDQRGIAKLNQRVVFGNVVREVKTVLKTYRSIAKTLEEHKHGLKTDRNLEQPLDEHKNVLKTYRDI